MKILLSAVLNPKELQAVYNHCRTQAVGLEHWVTTGDRLTIEFDLLANIARVLPAGRRSAPADDQRKEEEKMGETKLKGLLADCSEAWRAWKDMHKEVAFCQGDLSKAQEAVCEAQDAVGQAQIEKDNAEQAMVECHGELATLGQKYPCGCVEGGHWCDRHSKDAFSVKDAEARETDPRWNGEWLEDIRMKELEETWTTGLNEAWEHARDLMEFLEKPALRWGKESGQNAWDCVRQDLGDENKRLAVESKRLEAGIKELRKGGPEEWVLQELIEGKKQTIAENKKLIKDLATCRLRRLGEKRNDDD